MLVPATQHSEALAGALPDCDVAKRFRLDVDCLPEAGRTESSKELDIQRITNLFNDLYDALRRSAQRIQTWVALAAEASKHEPYI
jgi:hypothetical protein